MKSIVDMTQQEPVIMEFEGFVLRPFDPWHLWFEAPSGEGTQIRKDRFLGLLIAFFDEQM